MADPVGKTVRLESKKEINSTNHEYVQVHQGKVFVAGYPIQIPESSYWIITASQKTTGAYNFQNVATKKFLSSELPTFSVFVSDQLSDSNDWLLFGKKGTDVTPVSEFYSLDSLWLRNVKTGGCLSVRSNEGWTTSGKLWTRNDNNQPAGHYSWERYSFHIVGPQLAEESVESLKVKLSNAQKEIQDLKNEVKQLEEYRSFFRQFKSLVNDVK